MDTEAIFGLQFLMSLVVIGMLAKWKVTPWLRTLPQREGLFWLTVPHAFRHVGMVFLIPGVVAQPLPASFAYPAAYGDLATGLLAIVTLVLLQRGSAGAVPLVWTFNIVGSLDLLNALRHVEVAPLFGAAWYVPTFLVPLLLVSHVLVFSRLFGSLRRAGRTRTRRVDVSFDYKVFERVAIEL